MTARPTPLVRRLLIGGVVLLVAGLFLAGWVLWVPYEVSVRSGGAGGSEVVDCDAAFDGDPADPAFLDSAARFERACDDARSERRTTALLLGAALATAAAAATTIPSKRLMRLPADDESDLRT